MFFHALTFAGVPKKLFEHEAVRHSVRGFAKFKVVFKQHVNLMI